MSNKASRSDSPLSPSRWKGKGMGIRLQVDIWIPVTFIMAVAFLFLFVWHENVEGLPVAVWVSLLFAPPFVLMLWSLYHLKTEGNYEYVKYHKIFLLCIGCFVPVFWSFYLHLLQTIHGSSLLPDILSIAALIFAFLIIGYSLLLTGSLIGTRFPAILKLDQHQRHHNEFPFVNICFFLSLFSLITFFLSFSIAFHDYAIRISHQSEQDGRRVALYSVSPGQLSSLLVGSDTLDTTHALGNAASFESDRKAWIVFFEEFETVFEQESIANLSADTLVLTPDPEDARDMIRRHLNAYAYRAIAQELADRAKSNKHVDIEIRGHASEKPLRNQQSTFSSNTQLASIRAENMVPAIRRSLDQYIKNTNEKPEISYSGISAYGAGNFDATSRDAFERLSDEPSLFPIYGALELIKNHNRWIDTTLSVEIIIENIPPSKAQVDTEKSLNNIENSIRQVRDAIYLLPDKLTLLDYVYFTVYTITTTGYGDLKPNTPRVKFISASANFFEVIFLVVFFSVLLSSYSGSHVKESGRGNR